MEAFRLETMNNFTGHSIINRDVLISLLDNFKEKIKIAYITEWAYDEFFILFRNLDYKPGYHGVLDMIIEDGDIRHKLDCDI